MVVELVIPDLPVPTTRGQNAGVQNAGVPDAGVQDAGAQDSRLRDAVHPPAWQNPEPKDRYHLVVIGAGTAGLVTAAGAAGLGARVALVERGLMGGDCLNVGCVPSKGVIAAARAWSDARRARDEFNFSLVAPDGDGAGDGDGDFGAVMERMRRLRADIAPVEGAERFKSLGVDVFSAMRTSLQIGRSRWARAHCAFAAP